MNNNVGMEIVLNGTNLGKVIAEPTEGFYKNTYLVLLNKKGIKWKKGWGVRTTDSSERKKLCGKYGDNPNNRFWFFEKNFTYQFFGKRTAKLLANE